MADSLKQNLGSALLGTTDTQVFLGTAGHTYAVRAWVCNTDTAARTFRLNVVTAAGSSSATNQRAGDSYIEAGQTIPYGPWIIEGAGMIRGLADVASKVSVNVDGVDHT